MLAALKYDFERRNFLSRGMIIAPVTSAMGMPILSGERPEGMGWGGFLSLFTTLGSMTSAHPAIFFPLALGASLANICLRKEDERRRSIGESPVIHDYNSLFLGFSIDPRKSLQNAKGIGSAILTTLYGPNATATTRSTLTHSAITLVCFIGIGFLYYTAMPMVLNYMVPYAGHFIYSFTPNLIMKPMCYIASSYFPSAIAANALNVAKAAKPIEILALVDWARFSNFVTMNFVWPLIPAMISYANRVCDIYNGHAAYETVRTTVGAVNRSNVPIDKTKQVEDAIAAICQRSGPMEQLIATAIVLHDSKIDLMNGANNMYGKRNLFQGVNGFCQVVANRAVAGGNGALTQYLTSHGVAVGGVPALINGITNTDVVGILVNQNNKDVIRDRGGSKIDDTNLKNLVTTMAGLIHARPGCANIVNIDETVKLVKLACNAVERGR